MKVLILHSQLSEGAGADEEDVLVQVEAVSRALTDLGYTPVAAPFSVDVKNVLETLKADRPAFVFNLVETVEGAGRLIHLAPSLLDHLRLPYTGSSTEAIFITSNKLIAKKLLKASGIRTPPWLSMSDVGLKANGFDGPAIVKSVWEHASVGLDEDSVIASGNPGLLVRAMERRRENLGGSCFAEAYIAGREFNVSLLGGKDGPDVLPVAEIRFEGFPEEKLRVVGYRAKWASDSFEYLNTPRSFDFGTEDEPLLRELERLAQACWNLFELRGYARVDFRVDTAGHPWVLEVNTNPCLSPDAGFAAASERAGLPFERVIERIVADCFSPNRP